jgi:hypothetical protein
VKPNKNNPGKKKSWCKTCSREYSRNHYNQDKKYYLEKNKKNNKAFMERRFAWYLKQKQGKKCKNCGNDDPLILEFHHRASEEKIAAVSDLVNNYRPKDIILAEIAKCDLLCGNCHMLETIVDQNSWRSKGEPTEKLIEKLKVEMNAISLGDLEEARLHVENKFEPCNQCNSKNNPCQKCTIWISKTIYARRARTRFGLRDRIASMRAKLIAYQALTKEGCKDCAHDDWRVLQFDHISDDKSFDIGEAIGKSIKPERLMAEIAKCEVVCVNCHKRRTAQRHSDRKSQTAPV